MNLKQISDSTLLAETKSLVEKERGLLTQILHHLREIERRRLFATLGCSSLFTYCTEILRYSEAQAQRRISAMRLLRELPEIEVQIGSGTLSLTNLAQAGSFFRQEGKIQPLSLERKKQVLEKLENKSSREGLKVLCALSGAGSVAKVLERERVVTAELTEIRFAANAELLDKLKKLKGLLAHQNPRLGYADLIDRLCEFALDRLDPQRRPIRQLQAKNRRKEESEESVEGEKSAETPRGREEINAEGEKKAKPLSAPKVIGRKRLSVHVRREVWRRAAGRCENCGSDFALEIDHRRPVCLGGESAPANLRLLCRSCNARAAIEKLGLKKMDRHLNSSTP